MFFTLSLFLSLGSSLVAGFPIYRGFNSTRPVRTCGTAATPEFVAQAEAHFAENRVFVVAEANLAPIPVYCTQYFLSIFPSAVKLKPVRFTGHVIYNTTDISGGFVPDSQISASVDVLNADYASCGISFTLAGTDRTLNADWFGQVSPGGQVNSCHTFAAQLLKFVFAVISRLR